MVWLDESSAASVLKKLRGQTIAVGWSGGTDSTALLLMMKHAGFSVHAWHIDHAWHMDSANITAKLQTTAKAWNIPFFSQRLAPPPSHNREGLAREGRYLAFSTLGQQHNIQTLCLAHHADDQAETVCMRLLQGAGVKGCRGMRHIHHMQGLRIIRPLLHMHKQALHAKLEQAGIQAIEDPSNLDTSLWRNRLRQQLFPAIQLKNVDPVALFSRWQRQAVRLAEDVDAMAGEVAISNTDDGCSVGWQPWQQQPKPVRVEILQRMMAITCGAGKVLGRRHFLLIDTWCRQGGNHGLDLSGCRLNHQFRQLILKRRYSEGHNGG